jgi:hypothetical protein
MVKVDESVRSIEISGMFNNQYISYSDMNLTFSIKGFTNPPKSIPYYFSIGTYENYSSPFLIDSSSDFFIKPSTKNG